MLIIVFFINSVAGSGLLWESRHVWGFPPSGANVQFGRTSDGAKRSGRQCWGSTPLGNAYNEKLKFLKFLSTPPRRHPRSGFDTLIPLISVLMFLKFWIFFSRRGKFRLAEVNEAFGLSPPQKNKKHKRPWIEITLSPQTETWGQQKEWPTISNSGEHHGEKIGYRKPQN